jgi:hypothetical protein
MGMSQIRQTDFYKNSTIQSKPLDEGLVIHHDAVQEAVMDGSASGLVRDNKAAAELIRRGLEAKGKDPKTSTIAVMEEISPEDIQSLYTKDYSKQAEKLGGGELRNILQLKNPVASLTVETPNTPVDLSSVGISNTPNTQTPNPIQETVTDAYTISPTKSSTQSVPNSFVQRPTQTAPVGGAGSTQSVPLGTAGLSAIPQTISVRPQYTGTTMANLTMPSQGQQTIQSAIYKNDFGQTVTVTEVNGQPTTYVPPGYTKQGQSTANGFNQGGFVQLQTQNLSALPTGYQQTPSTQQVSPQTPTPQTLSSTVANADTDLTRGFTPVDPTGQQTETAFSLPGAGGDAVGTPSFSYPSGYTPTSFTTRTGGTRAVDPIGAYNAQQEREKQRIQDNLTRTQEGSKGLFSGSVERQLAEVQSEIDALNPVDEEGNPIIPEYRNSREQKEAEFMKSSRMSDLEKKKKDLESRMGRFENRYDRKVDSAQRAFDRSMSNYEKDIARDRSSEIDRFAQNLLRFQQEEAAKPAKTYEVMSRDLNILNNSVTAAEKMLSFGSYDSWLQDQVSKNPSSANYQAELRNAWDNVTGKYEQNKQRLAQNYGPDSWYSTYTNSMQQTGRGVPLPNSEQDRWIPQLGMRYSDYLNYMQNPDAVISPSEKLGSNFQPNDAIQYGISLNDVYDQVRNKQANIKSRIEAKGETYDPNPMYAPFVSMAEGGSSSLQVLIYLQYRHRLLRHRVCLQGLLLFLLVLHWKLVNLYLLTLVRCLVLLLFLLHRHLLQQPLCHNLNRLHRQVLLSLLKLSVIPYRRCKQHKVVLILVQKFLLHSKLQAV